MNRNNGENMSSNACVSIWCVCKNDCSDVFTGVCVCASVCLRVSVWCAVCDCVCDSLMFVYVHIYVCACVCMCDCVLCVYVHIYVHACVCAVCVVTWELCSSRPINTTRCLASSNTGRSLSL